MRRSLLAGALTVALTAAVLGACGSDPATGTVAPAGTTAGGTAGSAEALQFSAPTVGGGTLDLRTYAGTTVVFWFWAPTWSTCNREAPSVEEASKRYAGSAEFVGVAWFGDDAAFQGFIDRHGLTFPQLSDDGGAIFERFGVPAQPAMAVVHPDGSVERFLGAVDDAQLAEVLGAPTA